MIIDFHTHIFPDSIAEKTISTLAGNAGLTPFTNGTLAGLKCSMAQSGVTHSVTLPVVTKPSQFQSVNAFAAATDGKDGIVAFGGIHPRCDDYKKEIDHICSLGLKGVKLHPDYQGFYIDDESVYPLLDYAAQRGLVVVIHAGLDLGIPGEIKCTPKRARRMLRAVRCPNVVLAHTGGHACWQEVADCLVGEDVYLDTSFTLGRIEPALFLQIVRAHGSGKMLFATDSPWGGQREELAALRALDLPEEELEQILCGNAQRLLGWNK